MGGGVVLLVGAIVAVVIAVSSGGGSSSGASGGSSQITTLNAAAAAAGCTQINTPDSIARSDQNRQHVAQGTPVTYQTNPPSYGPHYPVPAHDGQYAPGQTPPVGNLVHAMEHGRVEIQYRAGLPAAQLNQLKALFNSTVGPWSGGQLLLLFQNTTGMPYAVAATAWGHVLGCPTFNSKISTAINDFRLAYTNQAPEQLGTGPE